MTNLPSECIILGGGPSINAEIMELKHRIKDKFVILTNYSFRYFEGTFLCFSDRDFYYPTQDCLANKCHPYIYDELKTLPLIIGINHNGVEEFKLPNTILLQKSSEYHRSKGNAKGFYAGHLSGTFALTLASYLMNYSGIIYLLGFDWNRREPDKVDLKNYDGTSDFDLHYYGQEIKHEGNRKIGYYERNSPTTEFKYFNEPKLKIYNVSLQSNIETFDKISYSEMFKLLNSVRFNQVELTNQIKEKLCIL